VGSSRGSSIARSNAVNNPFLIGIAPSCIKGFLNLRYITSDSKTAETRAVVFQYLRDLPVKAKAILGSAVLIGSVAGLGLFAVQALDYGNQGLRAFRSSTLPRVQTLRNIAYDAMEAQAQVFRLVALASSGRADVAELAARRNAIDSVMARVREGLEAVSARSDLTARERRIILTSITNWKNYIHDASKVLDSAYYDANFGVLMLPELDKVHDAAAREVAALSRLFSEESARTISALLTAGQSGMRVMALWVLAGVGLVILAISAMTAALIKPITDVTRAMRTVATGADAQIPLASRKDELGEMLAAVASFKTNLERREDELRMQNLRFDAALENMAQGLCMFDKNERLIVCNGVYKNLYNLPDRLCRPGTPLADIFAHRIASGFYASDVTVESMLAAGRARNARTEANVSHINLQDGRTIAIAHKPMPCGGYVATHEDVTEQKRAEARITHMARHDALTDLPNRVLFRERMDEALTSVRHRSLPVAVLYLDLDHFKRVNDTLGHPVGDALLKAVATRLQGCLRERDVIARLGGDEFAIIQFDSGAKEASTLAERIVESIAVPFEIQGHQVLIGTSVGIAIGPDDGLDADQLLKSADMALYKAKNDGRGTFRFFESEMDARAQQRRAVEMELRSALQSGEFEVFYQPLFATKTREIEGFEALVRWRHPEKGMVSPGEFIPVAEDTGLIVPIGEWVLRQACAEAANWGNDLKLAVNISPVQFRSKDLLRTVVSALASSSLPAARLELEITESVILQDGDGALATLKQFRELGIGIALDDFGTGYSSLSYLHQFPVTKIKIDRSFINSIGQRRGGLAVVRAVVEIARSLRMTVTAEGVETEQQIAKLCKIGCEQAQGYLVSPPVSAEKARELLPKLRNVA
jgi:diguanylate cyclase (GGDEF)-like protein